MIGGARGGARGLTLIEFLFATSVTAFVMLGVAGMFPSALRSVVVGGHTTKATALASEMVEAIRNDPFNLLLSRYNGFSTKSINKTVCPTLLPPTGYDPDYSKTKWACDLLADSAQTLGKGLPDGYGTISMTCRNGDLTLNNTNPCQGTLIRVVVTVYWERSSGRSVSYGTYISRAE